MAVKRRRKPVVRSVTQEAQWSAPTTPVTAEPVKRWDVRKHRGWLWLAVALGILMGWWWKTNSWPVVAFVGLKPVTRYEVNKALYAQGGEAIIDSIITQKLVEEELTKMGITADPARVNEQLEKMKQGLPEVAKWEEELANRGVSEKQIRDLLGLQQRLTTAVEKDATVSAQEVADYVKQNGQFMTGKTEADKQKEAGEALQQSKQGAAIEAFIAKVREAGMGRVWRFPAAKKAF